MRRAALAIAPIAFLLALAPAEAIKPIKPGQYTIGNIQEICLKNDGTWYGTTFNMSGRWIVNPVVGVLATIYGNYAVQGHDGAAYGNTALSVRKMGANLQSYWSDWFDDLSYGFYNGFGFFPEKSKCDVPFTGENTKAPTQ